MFKTLKNKIEDTRTWKKILEHKRASHIPPLKELALWKWLYSTISSLQDQCNFHKNANNVLHRNRKWVLKNADGSDWKMAQWVLGLTWLKSEDQLPQFVFWPHTHTTVAHYGSYTSTPCKSKKNFRKLMKVQKVLRNQSNSDWKTMLGGMSILDFQL